MRLYLREIALLCKIYTMAVIKNRNHITEIQYELNKGLKNHDFHPLTVKEGKRILYYCNQCAFAASVFAKFTSRNPYKEEIVSACYFGVGVLFQDDLIDNINYKYENFMQKMQGSETGVLHNRYEWLTWYAHQKITDYKKSDNSFLAIIAEAESAQARSRQQLDKNISQETLFEIIALKGGSSTYFVRALLKSTALPAEKKWIYQLGEVLQWTNDAFDIYKDHTDGIQSLFSDQTDLRPRRRIMEEKITALKQHLFQLPIPKNDAQYIWDMFFCIISRGLVSLDQAEKLQDLAGGIFKVENYTRKQLVCDMEKPANIIACLRYMAKWK